MSDASPARRSFCAAAAAAVVAGRSRAGECPPPVLLTFGDSILDCGSYNAHGVHPAALIVRNDDRLFPEFRGQDLSSRGGARLVHGAVDGATVEGLHAQLARVGAVAGPGAVMLTIGGNDLLLGLAADRGPGIAAFERTLAAFLARLRVRPVLIGNVYDPTFGDDRRNFLAVDAATARRNHARVNEVLRQAAARHGVLVDLHAHFLQGDPSWFTQTIEPSLRGASEVRRAFLPHVINALGNPGACPNPSRTPPA